jgi:hypothetical protein
LAAFPAAFFCGLIAIPATGGSAPDVGRSDLYRCLHKSGRSIDTRTSGLAPQVRHST